MRMDLNTFRGLACAGIALAGLTFAVPAHADTPDGWITTKTKLDLMTTDGVSGTAINVDTTNGNVVLHGKVKSEIEKEKAGSVAKSVDGVKSVKNLLQVVPASSEKAVEKKDSDIKTAADKALKAEKDIGDISIASVNNGVVLLSGKADTIDEHLRAVRSVSRLAGVKRVASEVTTPDDKLIATTSTSATAVATSDYDKERMHHDGRMHKMGEGVNDRKITADAKIRLMADSKVPALDINVDTNDGVVTLFGAVPNQAAKAAAEADVRKINGVKGLKDELQIVAASEKKVIAAKDDDIEKSVKGAFTNMKDFEKISVDAKNGVVRLSGQVPRYSDELKAATIARSQPGVRAVEEDLKVAEK